MRLILNIQTVATKTKRKFQNNKSHINIQLYKISIIIKNQNKQWNEEIIKPMA